MEKRSRKNNDSGKKGGRKRERIGKKEEKKAGKTEKNLGITERMRKEWAKLEENEEKGGRWNRKTKEN